jgi:hypothetical protein
MNRRHASSNSARLIAPLLKICSLGAMCLVVSSNTNIAPPYICNRDLSTATVRLPRGRPGTVRLMRCSVSPAPSATGAAPCAPTAEATAAASTRAAASTTAAAMSASVSMAPTPPATTELASACGGPSSPSLATSSRSRLSSTICMLMMIDVHDV